MQRRKQMWPLHKTKRNQQKLSLKKIQILDLLDKDFKSTILNMLKELKETRKITYEQIENIN